MKLQKIPILAAVILGTLSLSAMAFGGHGGGARGGGVRGFVAAGPRGFVAVAPRQVVSRPFVATGSQRFVVAGPRGVVAGRFGNRALIAQRFDRRDHRFDNRRRFQAAAFVGAGGYSYPYSAGYPYPYSPNYNYPDYVGSYDQGLGTGDVVANVQRVLSSKGFYRGPIDGVSGPATRAAIRAYDAAAGLPVTGTINSTLLASLGMM